MLLGLGENLWKKFLPKYLEALGAPIRAIGVYGSLSDLIDGLYQYPGGWLGDHLGRRRALLLFVASATVGYAIYAFAPTWPFALVALAFAAAWTSMASPTLFAVIADSMPRETRALGFTLLAILKRVPIIVAPVVGGLVIARMGVVGGMHVLFLATIAMAVVTLLVVHRIDLPRLAAGVSGIAGVWSAFPASLRWLLVSDVFIRTCEGMAEVFLVIYATRVIGVTAPQFGVLVAIQAATSMAVYIPAARNADRFGRKPFVIATFAMFALFPVSVAFSRSFAMAIVAYVIGGLREIGEPSRKALIVDYAHESMRARTVGLYYLIRSCAIAPAAIIGGLLWERSAMLPLLTAGVIGAAGTIVFAMTVRDQ
jgi:MFS family permease